MRNLVIIGASGFAREMYDLALACYGDQSDFKIKGFLGVNLSTFAELAYLPVLITV